MPEGTKILSKESPIYHASENFQNNLFLLHPWKTNFHFPLVGIKDPPVAKTDTQETENLDKAISFDKKGASIYSLQLSRHMSTKWLLMSLMQLYLPSPGICPSQRFTVCLNCLKVLGDRVGHVIWRAIFMGKGTVQESIRNRNPLNNTSHLRW
jgi:hypothetical protein